MGKFLTPRKQCFLTLLHVARTDGSTRCNRTRSVEIALGRGDKVTLQIDLRFELDNLSRQARTLSGQLVQLRLRCSLHYASLHGKFGILSVNSSRDPRPGSDSVRAVLLGTDRRENGPGLNKLAIVYRQRGNYPASNRKNERYASGRRDDPDTISMRA